MDAYVSFVFWMDVPYLKSGDNGSAQGLWEIPVLKYFNRNFSLI